MFDIAVNYVAVLVAAIAAFGFGAIWHGPLFGKLWMKLNGLTAKDMKKPMKNGMTPAKSMIAGFFSTLLVAFVLAKFIGYFAITTKAAALVLAFWLWLGFTMPINLGSSIWEGKSCKLFALNTAFRLVELSVLATVLACFA